MVHYIISIKECRLLMVFKYTQQSTSNHSSSLPRCSKYHTNIIHAHNKSVSLLHTHTNCILLTVIIYYKIPIYINSFVSRVRFRSSSPYFGILAYVYCSLRMSFCARCAYGQVQTCC